MKSLDVFNAAFIRAEHFLSLYSILHDTRSRRIRSDWAERFKDLMHWPQGEEIVRVDGKNLDSMLILRESIGITRKQFSHDYISELLRSAIVSVVSALDRYLHDQVVYHSWKLLSQKQEDIPKELAQLELPVLATKRALEQLKRDEKSRPGFIVKQAIQKHLHQKFTFQNPSNVITACKMLGVENLWGEVSRRMPGNQSNSSIIENLKSIVDRRNKIVHESDIPLKIKAKKVTLRPLTLLYTKDTVYWIKDLVYALDDIINQSV